MVLRLEVIDFNDPSNQALVARMPESGTAAIVYGAQLVVQQNQEAIFFREGKAMDRFGPGVHRLTTSNIPILSKVLNSPWEKSPFQACVYFVAKQIFHDQRWGTRQPIMIRDPDFGAVRLRGFGKFAYRVSDASLLVNSLVGTQGRITTQEINDFLRDSVVSGLTDFLSTANVPLLQLPEKFDEVAAAARVKLAGEFSRYGLELVQFVISSITPPEEVERAIDAKMSERMGGRGAWQPERRSPVEVSDLSKSVEREPPRGSKEPAGDSLNDPSLLEKAAIERGWKVNSNGQDLLVNVPLGQFRRQQVKVDFGLKSDQSDEYVGLWTVCGPMNPSNAATMLRMNQHLLHGGFSLMQTGSSELLVIRSNLTLGSLTVNQLLETIAALAWQADSMEQQLSGAQDRW
jgi:hypothetical protein